MDVDQAMQLADGTADVRDFAAWVEAATTLAAEVRRLRGHPSPVILDRIRDMGWSQIVDEATAHVKAAEAARRKA